MKKETQSITFKNQNFYVGIDVHKKRWVVTIRHSGLSLKTFSMDPCPEQLKKYLYANYPQGTYHITYEIGFSGFWICRRFKQLGMDCIVVNSADIPPLTKRKTKNQILWTHISWLENSKKEIFNLYMRPVNRSNT